MAYEVLAHKFDVGKVHTTVKTDVFQNIRKRKERVIYSGKTLRDNINLAYLQADEVTSDSNLFLSDHSFLFGPNVVKNNKPVKFSGTSYTSEVNQFLLTDKFTTETPSLPETPLFFKHIISQTRYVPVDDTIVSLEVLDLNFRVVSKLSELLVVDDDHDGAQYGVVYNNLQNTLDEGTGLFEVFYVKYSVRKLDGTTVNYVELLNNQPVYREATFDDLDSFNQVKPNRKVYVLDEGFGTFTISQLTNSNYYIIQKLKTRLFLEKPSTKTIQQQWQLTASGGEFFTVQPFGSTILKYEIAEFTAQNFSPFAPYKTVADESPRLLSGTLYKTGFKNIFTDTAQGMDFVVELVEADGDTVQTFSYNAGTGIRSIDKANGFFDLIQKPAPHLSIKVSYIYEEKGYQISEVDFNPVFNTAAKDEMVAFYVVPQSSTRDRTFFYVRVNKEGRIIYSSQAEYGDDWGIALRGEGFGTDGNALPSPIFTYADFKTQYTTEDDGPSPNAAFLILGEVYVGESVAPEDILLVDTRVRGGGLKEVEGLLDRSLESAWNWDIGHWDGSPFPGTCTFFVEVPCELLTTNGGTTTKEEIRTVVQKHMAMGFYPVIRTYGDDPIITSFEVRDDEIDLEWTDLGSGITYNVYMSTSVTGPFTKLTGSPLVANFYTATGLTSGLHYWFFVTGVEDGHECTDSDSRYMLELQTR